MPKVPLVSAIIPTHNEEKDIAACIQSLQEQTYPAIEIIIVDDGSTDRTKEKIREFKKVQLLEGAHKGPGFSRNLGAGVAKGDILLFVDADMTFAKDYVDHLVLPLLQDRSLVGTTHDYEVVKNISNIWSRCWGKIRVSPENARKVKIFRAIRKSRFLEMGGFDPKYGYADDQTFWFKHQIKPVVAPGTLCYHKNPETLNGVYRQSRWIGASLEYPLSSSRGVKYLIPFFLLLVFPVLIPIYVLKKCYQNRDVRIFFWMIPFIAARYFGTWKGQVNKIYFDHNTR